MATNAKYHKVGDEEAQPVADVELGSLPEQSSGRQFTLKILHRETTSQISGLTELSTVAQLKHEIEMVTQTPAAQQRLIFSGRPLRPDDKTLKSFNITNGSSIHLFPLPVAQATPVGQTAIAANAAPLAPLANMLQPAAFDIAHLPIHFDPLISQHIREVKLWSLILVFLSGMTLFNNISYSISTGSLGDGIFDSLVTSMDTLCSLAGVFVGQLGLQSARTADLPTITKYVSRLIVLALFCIVLRICWVFDVVFEVEDAVREAKKAAQSKGAGSGTGSGTTTNPPSSGDQPTAPDDNVIMTFGIQAVCIALVCISAWINCVIRAIRFHSSVRQYNETANPVGTGVATPAPVPVEATAA